jgi:DNA-binding winged helix-turn-helix (wHTH) protein/Tfp pilus assembly protein PilF
MSRYRFGPFSLEVDERRLMREGQPVALTPKAFDTLAYLVSRPGRLVGKDELLQVVWAGAFVEEGALARTIHVLRKTLTASEGDTGHPQYIETVPTKGYRFVAPVSTSQTPSARDAVTAGQFSQRRTLWVAAALMILVIAGSAWRALGVASAPLARRGASRTDSGGAYARFQSGRAYLERHLPGDIDAALRDFEAATQFDSTFASAYAGKADAYIFRYWDTGAHDDIARARLAARKSLALDPDSAYGHAMLCRILGTDDWDFAAAEQECRRAVDLDPHDHEIRREMAMLLNATGRHADALTEMDTAITIAPTSFNKRSRGMLLYFDRRFDEAIAQLKQVEATDPDFVETSRWIARCFEQKKEYGLALEFLVRFRESRGAEREELATLRQAFDRDGWPGVLRASLARGSAPTSLDAAGSFAQLGDLDAAFRLLESMIDTRTVMTIHMESEPRLEPLRADPRFEQLTRRVGLR